LACQISSPQKLKFFSLVRSEWSVTDTSQKARFYTITAAERRQLTAEKAEWDRMTIIMHRLLQDQS